MIVLLMGVTGSGKTTVGQLLAQQLGWEFADADSFHSPASVERMRQGIPLDDAERAPWLNSIHAAMVQRSNDGRSVVLACSALKRAYRQQLTDGLQVRTVYLKGTFGVISDRLRDRRGHFATANLLASQFATLEEPQRAMAVNIEQTPEEIVTEIRNRLGLA
jgi:gluconokinase